jgi:tRNA(Ile2) C34 agmatinyltransferase TiaS
METEVYRSVYTRCPYCKASIPKQASGVVRCAECGKRIRFTRGKATKV